jgi:hypothetical protein
MTTSPVFVLVLVEVLVGRSKQTGAQDAPVCVNCGKPVEKVAA